MQIVPVSSNVTWASTNIIALYCTQYKALFGSVDLKMAMANKGAPHLPLCQSYLMRCRVCPADAVKWVSPSMP